MRRKAFSLGVDRDWTEWATNKTKESSHKSDDTVRKYPVLHELLHTNFLSYKRKEKKEKKGFKNFL